MILGSQDGVRIRLLAGSSMRDSIPGLGSRPELKADAQLLSHPGVPEARILKDGYSNQRARSQGEVLGRLGGSAVEHLPSAQGMILESRDQVPHQLPAWSLFLPLPVSVSLINRQIKS